ncbi:hypothetical protein D3C85_1870340 [compost metagenome]
MKYLPCRENKYKELKNGHYVLLYSHAVPFRHPLSPTLTALIECLFHKYALQVYWIRLNPGCVCKQLRKEITE